jgi:hypothetical protein
VGISLRAPGPSRSRASGNKEIAAGCGQDTRLADVAALRSEHRRGRGGRWLVSQLTCVPEASEMVGRWSSCCRARSRGKSGGARRTVLGPGHAGAGPSWFIRIG